MDIISFIFAIFAYDKRDPCLGSDCSGERRMLVISKIENSFLGSKQGRFQSSFIIFRMLFVNAVKWKDYFSSDWQG